MTNRYAMHLKEIEHIKLLTLFGTKDETLSIFTTKNKLYFPGRVFLFELKRWHHGVVLALLHLLEKLVLHFSGHHGLGVNITFGGIINLGTLCLGRHIFGVISVVVVIV